jgi:hypothetical protein
MPNIRDNQVYILSGVSSNSTGFLGCRGYNNQTYHFYGAATGLINSTGDIALMGRVMDDSPFITFFSTQLRSSTGDYKQFSNITWNAVQAVISNYSGGSITVAARIQS